MLLIILALLFIGLTLVVVEVIFIPGTTLIGVLGIIFSIGGIIVAYQELGNETGFKFLIGAASINLVAFILALRAELWTKFSLKSSMTSKVNEDLQLSIQIGDIGIALSTLRPVGKAEFKDRQYEVKTSGAYVEHGREVKVINIEARQIIVEPTN